MTMPLGGLVALAVVLDALLLLLPPGLSIFDARFHYTAGEAAAYLASLGPAGRRAYFVHELVDLAFIATYTTLLRRLAVRWSLPRPLHRLAFAPGAADLVETVGILVVLAAPTTTPLLPVIAVATTVKWILAAIVLVSFVTRRSGRPRTG